MESFISDYGYLAIVLGTFLEGETILVLAGFAAHRGYLDLGGVMGAAFLGTLIGDQLYFYLGRTRGQRFLAARPGWANKVEKVSGLLARHQVLLILSFRFLYGIRTVAPFAIGAARVDPMRYLVLNVIGAAVWSVVIGALGYYFGHAVELILDDVKRYEVWVILAVILVAVAVWLWRRMRERRRAAG